MQAEIFARARGVCLLVLDVDGVMTDGKLYFSNQGDELKAFNILDGQGIKLLQTVGIRVAVITGRQSEIVERRAANLGIELVLQNREDKLKALDEILATLDLGYDDVAYVGDDLPDLACIAKVALGVSVPNAHPLVKEKALCLTTCSGGQGAVREVCDWILQAQDKYDDAVAPYL
ncbi:MAG: 3-deoxy-manno-octulosonate-8-phosphatase KdsC [Pseudohongiellaceae bacterium]